MDDNERLAPEGTGTEGATTDSEGSQPAPEGDEADQQQQPEDLFLGVTDEQIRERYAHLFKTDAEQQWELGRREGQGTARSEIAAIRKQDKLEEADRIAFRRLENMRTSDDPDVKDAYFRERDDPETDAAYRRGKEAVNRPAPEVVERMKDEVGDFFFNQLDAHLNDRKELQGLSDEEKAGLAKENHPTLGALVDAKIDLAIQRGVAAGVTKENAQKLQDVKDEGHREAYDEMGLQYPAEHIEGRKPAKPGSETELRDQYADGDIETDEYKRKMEAIGAKP